ncbi:hypothetical protein [Alicyclobacillus shizuokensis]|uniref:hypothetical protein n=1 Tax=Alicyclobacillus shizuokensis TaxID=392014 RepID=UPI00082C234C|nr:hypothetical protein [Alicyclobacillus shizuokensis]
MAKVKKGFRAVFYAHGQIMLWGPIREDEAAAIRDIYEYHHEADLCLRDPYTHAEVHEVWYPYYDV